MSSARNAFSIPPHDVGGGHLPSPHFESGEMKLNEGNVDSRPQVTPIKGDSKLPQIQTGFLNGTSGARKNGYGTSMAASTKGKFGSTRNQGSNLKSPHSLNFSSSLGKSLPFCSIVRGSGNFQVFEYEPQGPKRRPERNDAQAYSREKIWKAGSPSKGYFVPVSESINYLKD